METDRLPRGRRGLGKLANPEEPKAHWSGQKAMDWVKLVLVTYGPVCWLCGLPGSDTADHVIPRVHGGAVYDLDNLAPAHRRCNESRGSRPAEAYSLVEDGQHYFTED